PQRSACMPEATPPIPDNGVYTFPITINIKPKVPVVPTPPEALFDGACLYYDNGTTWELVGGCGEWIIAEGKEVPAFVRPGTQIPFPDTKPPQTVVVLPDGTFTPIPLQPSQPTPGPSTNPIPVLDVAPKTPTKGTKWKGPDGTVWMGDGKEWKPINTTIPPG